MATRMRPQSADRPAGAGGTALEIERGPGWLFVQVGAGAGGKLAESVWETIREHGASRVVLELDRVERVDETLDRAIADLGTRVRDAGGLIRICGLPPAMLSKLRSVGPAGGVPHFDNRSDAIGPRRVEAGSCE